MPVQQHLDLTQALKNLGDTKHLVRERAAKHLATLLGHDAHGDETQTADIVSRIWEAGQQLADSEAWEGRLGCLLACQVLVQAKASDPYHSAMISNCLKLLEDSEPRVREAVGNLLGALAGCMGAPAVWFTVSPTILDSVNRNFDRDALTDTPNQVQSNGAQQTSASQPTIASQNHHAPDPQAAPAPFLSSLLSDTYKPLVPGHGQMRHGTEGWRCLESNMRAVVEVIRGGGASFKGCATPALVDLLCRCAHHPNRFVREAAHLAVAALCDALSCSTTSTPPAAQTAAPSPNMPDSSRGSAPNPATIAATTTTPANMSTSTPASDSSSCTVDTAYVGRATAPLLADGLTDNWSQVRFAACMGARSLLLAVGTQHALPSLRDELLSVLVPPLCLNRYYVADGVRSAAQDTWQAVMGDSGRATVARYIEQVATYYIAQSKAVHHGVREAACACIAELAEKIDSAVVAPRVPLLMPALVLCCKDMAWPVRDAGCTAAGRCCRALPAACRPFLSQLLDLWVAHLSDNVQSVRQNSALALADALHAYPHDPLVLDTVQTAIRNNFAELDHQAKDSPRGREPARHPHPAGDPDLQGANGAATQTALLKPDSALLSTSGAVAPSSPHTGRSGSSAAPGSPRSPLGSPRFGRSRSPQMSKGRALSPARVMEQQIKAALAANPDLFSSGEDLALFSDSTAERFCASVYVKGDGCMDFGFSRDQEPWESADGAVHMVAELATVRPQVAAEHLGVLAAVASRSEGFPGAEKLRESVWRVLPRIGSAIGKQLLKRHLEPFLKPLFEDLTCGTALTEVAAGKAVGCLRDSLGFNILLHRLTDAQAHALRTCEVIPPPAGNGLSAAGARHV